MIDDPIVREVRALRDEIRREHNYDIDAIFAMLRKAEASSGRKHVTLAPRKPDQQLAGADRGTRDH